MNMAIISQYTLILPAAVASRGTPMGQLNNIQRLKHLFNLTVGCIILLICTHGGCSLLLHILLLRCFRINSVLLPFFFPFQRKQVYVINVTGCPSDSYLLSVGLEINVAEDDGTSQTKLYVPNCISNQ